MTTTLERLASRLEELAHENTRLAEKVAALETRSGPTSLPVWEQAQPGTRTGRRALLRSAIGVAAASVGAGTLLETSRGTALASTEGTLGQTTFLSATTTPTVTIKNTSTGLGLSTANKVSLGGTTVTSLTSFGLVSGGSATVLSAVAGINSSTAASAIGTYGQIKSTVPGSFSAGVRGQNNGTGVNGIGVYGSQAGGGYGVYGTSVSGIGVYGLGTGSGSTGVYGSGSTYGVNTVGGTYGLYATGGNYGAYVYSSSGLGLYAYAPSGTAVYANASSGTYGVQAYGATYGVYGNGGSYGFYGYSSSGDGIYAYGGSTGGYFSGGSYGVQGYGATGVYTSSSTYVGVEAHGATNGIAAFGASGWSGGYFSGDAYGISSYGTNSNSYGVYANGGINGVYAYCFNSGTAALCANNSTYGLYAYGNIGATGTKYFRIDHPLDPANKYLLHACIESSEMMNLYTGVAVLDVTGRAVVALPAWFGALNRDYRYQLTALGAAAPGLYIAAEIAHNQFVIAGGTAGLKVSWQVTGLRQDAWAQAHPMVVEEDKTGAERGLYQHPALFGASADKGILNRLNANAGPGLASRPAPLIEPVQPRKVVPSA